MSARLIEWPEGTPFALLISDDAGDPMYVVPPLVYGIDGAPTAATLDILAAIAQSGVTVEVPVLRDVSVGDLADIDQRVQRISESLGVPTISAFFD